MASIDTPSDPIATARQETRRAGPSATAPQRVAEPPRFVPRRRDNPWLRRLLMFGACVLMADALFGDWGLAQTIRARRDYEQAATSLARLRQDNAGLRERARRLQDDPAAIETVAREELGLIRPGEILVVVSDVK